MVDDNGPVLAIRNLTVDFEGAEHVVHAVAGVDCEVWPGETLAIVGETGSGKTSTVLGALRLLSNSPRVGGSVMVDGEEILTLSDRQLRRKMGSEIAVIFQNPSVSLNPVMTVGHQIVEAIGVHHRRVSRAAARERALELMRKVGISHPELRFDQYPHEFSGGMCQRVAIAIAIANKPRLLIADEPTTSLDVTVQAQIMALLKEVQRDVGSATILITHDMGLVAQFADRVTVMYGGRTVESGLVEDIFARPMHPYTVGLLAAIPRPDVDTDRLRTIPGNPPDASQLGAGCPFEPRCPIGKGRATCIESMPPLVSAGTEGGQAAACHFLDEIEAIREDVYT